jgi:hypothetical protein
MLAMLDYTGTFAQEQLGADHKDWTNVCLLYFNIDLTTTRAMSVAHHFSGGISAEK